MCSQGWQLVLTGHSLGAGVAALLALKMLRSFPKAKVWAFCPPGGLLTGTLAHYMAPFCTSVVLGKVRDPETALPCMLAGSRLCDVLGQTGSTTGVAPRRPVLNQRSLRRGCRSRLPCAAADPVSVPASSCTGGRRWPLHVRSWAAAAQEAGPYSRRWHCCASQKTMHRVRLPGMSAACCAQDGVPRTSMHNVARMMDHAVEAIARGRLSKVCAALQCLPQQTGDTWEPALLS